MAALAAKEIFKNVREIYLFVRAGLPEIAVQECDAMKRLTSRKLNAVQCKHRWKGLVLTPEAHINPKKAQTEVKTDRLDLLIRISTSTTYRMEREKTDRRTLGDVENLTLV